MAKWYGQLGYGDTVERNPGVYEVVIKEREYYGDVYKDTRKIQSGEGLNDNINLSNIISIISDPFANENFHNIRYVTFMGTKWKVSNVEVLYPRLKLTIGSVYNG